jgi:excisionase family DNA binding protein
MNKPIYLYTQISASATSTTKDEPSTPKPPHGGGSYEAPSGSAGRHGDLGRALCRHGDLAATHEDERSAEALTLSVPEAAKLLGISRALAYELVTRGELPSLRLGRRIVVPRVALMSLVEGHDYSGCVAPAGVEG